MHLFLKRICDSASDRFGNRPVLRLEARLLMWLHLEMKMQTYIALSLCISILCLLCFEATP